MTDGTTIEREGNPWPELQCDSGCRPPMKSDVTAAWRASGREGERWVCSHGAVWELVWRGPGDMTLHWHRRYGWAAWRARRNANRSYE